MRQAAAVVMAMAGLAGCSYQGLNSLPLPGTSGHGAGSYEVKVQFQNVDQVVPNSDVMVNDVNVGSVTSIRLQGWHALATLRLNGGVALPANATASIGQQSLLGAMYIALAPPAAEKATGRLQAGATIPLARSATYPSTEETLAAVGSLLNGGGLKNVSVITSQLNQALGGRTTQVRQVLDRVDTMTADLNQNKGNIVAAFDGLDRLGTEAAANNKLIGQTLNEMPPALSTLNTETPAFVQAMSNVSTLSKSATGIINDSTGPLAKNLNDLMPALKATAAARTSLIPALGILGSALFPLSTWRGVVGQGGYIDLFVTLHLTNSAISRYYLELLQGVLPQGALPKGSASTTGTSKSGSPLAPLLQPLTGKSGSTSSAKPSPTPSPSSKGLSGLLGILGG
jgi:phospholipid/cholesterol/gamma-HCH transport system substrate-binding protein